MQVKIACSNFNSAVVGEDGSLYIWGSARSGLLGIGDTIKNQKTPSRMVFPPVEPDAISAGIPQHKVMHVSMGPYHAAVVTQNSVFDKIRTDRFMPPVFKNIAKKQLNYLRTYEPETYKSMSTIELKDAAWKYEEFTEFIDALQVNDYTQEEARQITAFKKSFLDYDDIDPDTNNPKVNVVQYVYELDKIVREEQEAQVRISVGLNPILDEINNTRLLSRHIAYVWGLKENGRLGLPGVADNAKIGEKRATMSKDILKNTNTIGSVRGGSYLKQSDSFLDRKGGGSILGGIQALTEQAQKRLVNDDDEVPEKPDEEDQGSIMGFNIKTIKHPMEIENKDDDDDDDEEKDVDIPTNKFQKLKLIETGSKKKSPEPFTKNPKPSKEQKGNTSANKINTTTLQKTNLSAISQDDGGPKDQEKYSGVTLICLPGTEITKITCGNAFTIALDTLGRVWAWGKGADGCLGNGHLFDQYEPVSPLSSRFFQTEKNPNGKVYDIAAGSQHVLATTKDGSLVSWGKGLHGRLGHGNDMSQLYPNRVNFFSSEKESLKVTLIAAGDQHSACVTNKKEIYTWGCGANYRLGHGVNFDELSPRKVTSLEDVDTLFVSCGSLHTTCITNEGAIYAWGSGLNGRLGCETKIGIDAKIPTKVGQLYSDIKKIIFKQVAAGPSHTLAVSENGDLYAWGSYKFHILGLSDAYQDINIPTKVQGKYYNPEREYEKRQHMLPDGDDEEGDLAFAKRTIVNPANIYDLEYQKKILEYNKRKNPEHGIIRVFCGESNTAFLTDGGDVFITGSGKFGELGINPEETNDKKDDSREEELDMIRTKDTFFSMIPQHIALSGSTKFKHLAIGSGHIIGITLSGRAYAWGCNTNSQLGLGKLEKFFYIPQLVEGLSAKDNVMAACGPNFSAVLNQSGEIWVFGTAEYGCLGLIDNKLVYDASTPKMINDIEPMKHIACGSQHMACISHDGRIFSWGNGQNGRLGNGTKNTIFKPGEVKVALGNEAVKFKQIGCGRLHTLALDVDGNIWVTGVKQYAGLDFQVGTDMGEINAFKRIEFRDKTTFKHISVGEYHNIAVSIFDETWGWGKMDYGQLGQEARVNLTDNQSKISNISGPKKIDVNPQDEEPVGKIEYVAAGVNHSALSTSDGKVFVWGCGLSGRLGISNEEILELYKQNKIKNDRSVMTMGTPYKITYNFKSDVEKGQPEEVGKDRATPQRQKSKKDDVNVSMNQSVAGGVTDRKKGHPFDPDSALNKSYSSRASQKKAKVGKDTRKSAFANPNDRSNNSIRPDPGEDENKKKVEEEQEDEEEHLLEGQRLKDYEKKRKLNILMSSLRLVLLIFWQKTRT